jgi:hypothetical protein
MFEEIDAWICRTNAAFKGGASLAPFFAINLKVSIP